MNIFKKIKYIFRKPLNKYYVRVDFEATPKNYCELTEIQKSRFLGKSVRAFWEFDNGRYQKMDILQSDWLHKKDCFSFEGTVEAECEDDIREDIWNNVCGYIEEHVRLDWVDKNSGDLIIRSFKHVEADVLVIPLVSEEVR